jgi:hypothetical protein
MLTRAERIGGGLIGLLVGDALGVPYEFHRFCGAEPPAVRRGEEAPLLLSGSAATGSMVYGRRARHSRGEAGGNGSHLPHQRVRRGAAQTRCAG